MKNEYYYSVNYSKKQHIIIEPDVDFEGQQIRTNQIDNPSFFTLNYIGMEYIRICAADYIVINWNHHFQ